MNEHTIQANPVTVNLTAETSIEFCWWAINEVFAEATDEELESIVEMALTSVPEVLKFDSKHFVIGIDVQAVRGAFREKRERDRADQRFLETLKEGLEMFCPRFANENLFFEVLSEALKERRRSPELE